MKKPTMRVEGVFYKIISSCTPTFKVLFGRTMLLITTTSSSTSTDSPGHSMKRKFARVIAFKISDSNFGRCKLFIKKRKNMNIKYQV